MGSRKIFTASADGRFNAFESAATNLVPADTNGLTDIFVHDLASGETTRASVDFAGTQSGWDSDDPSISADGRFSVFGIASRYAEHQSALATARC